MNAAKPTLVYIAGDGRSGSSLLSSLLNTAEDTFFVGESYRFWNRYYAEKPSLCGCGTHLPECPFWNQVHQGLQNRYPNYSGPKIWEQLQFLLRYQNAKKLPQLLKEPHWESFLNCISYFYELLFSISKASVLIDSSKNMGWLLLLQQIQLPQDLQVIFLKRDLLAVANSWKKEVRLPEFEDGSTFMPQKSNWEILKARFKINSLSKCVSKNSSVQRVAYEEFIANPKETLQKLEALLGITLHDRAQPHHAIGGNPMLFGLKPNTPIVISKPNRRYENLSLMDRLFFACFRYL
ncbi:MAG TPA: sulfotransferase [Flavobacteriaceae bacterium]|nr:sulfotransferase [Flavobacteriaceae bacterium]MCB9213491.1 sulfotransferase [Alteromonas sp.]HPF12206.1 sulfotransferase [Flavobacteriaceae bacterium]HQU22007.1 sulfotransferase [Flavobacteriaceae bacterium]HQU65906.1 sulfotransferase [Flavobacteriaceae bacterium]